MRSPTGMVIVAFGRGREKVLPVAETGVFDQVRSREGRMRRRERDTHATCTVGPRRRNRRGRRTRRTVRSSAHRPVVPPQNPALSASSAVCLFTQPHRSTRMTSARAPTPTIPLGRRPTSDTAAKDSRFGRCERFTRCRQRAPGSAGEAGQPLNGALPGEACSQGARGRLCGASWRPACVSAWRVSDCARLAGGSRGAFPAWRSRRGTV
jgi:hypothetical protein